jgi:hypothetical protein
LQDAETGMARRENRRHRFSWFSIRFRTVFRSLITVFHRFSFSQCKKIYKESRKAGTENEFDLNSVIPRFH